MLTILATDDAPHPSRQWVEDFWRVQPATSPSWWRENLGFSHSKLVADCTGQTHELTLPLGINAVLISRPLPKVEEGLVQIGVTDDPQHAFGDVPVWRLPNGLDGDVLQHGLLSLEHSAQRSGGFYGVLLPVGGTLGGIMTHASRAAETVWARKKRPSLRVVLVPFDVLTPTPLLVANETHKDDAVPLLELAARLGLWAVALPGGLDKGEQPVEAEALAAVQAVVEIEQTLHTALQGQWPHVGGQPVFAVLPFLQSGQAPWVLPHQLAAWRSHAWPALQQAFTAVPPALGTPWQQAWQRLLPHLDGLAGVAYQQAVSVLIRQRQALLEPAWHLLSTPQKHAMLLASVPGIGGVVVSPSMATDALLALPDMADVGPFFGV